MHNNNLNKANQICANFADWVLRNNIMITVIFIFCIVGSALQFPNLRTDFSVFNFYNKDDKSLEFYNKFMEEYGNDDFVYIVYENSNGIFAPDTLQKTKKLTEELSKVPFIKKVNSLVNIEFIQSSKDAGIHISGFMDKLPKTREEAERLKKLLLNKPHYVNTYISKDAEYAAILCEIENEAEKIDPSYQTRVLSSVFDVLNNREFNNFKFYPTGNGTGYATLLKLTEENVLICGAISFLLTTILLIVIFRHIKAVISPFLIILLTFIIILAIMALRDIPITIMFSMIPTIILAIGIADAVHLMSEYQIHLKHGYNNRTSILKAVKLVCVPCLFTSLTTSICFSSLFVSPIQGIIEFGLILAIGTIVLFIISFTFLLVVMQYKSEKTEKKFSRINKGEKNGIRETVLASIAKWNYANYKIVIVVFIFLTGISIFGITKLEINTSHLMMVGDKVQMYKDFTFVDKVMGGTANFEVLLNSGKPEGVNTFKFLEILDKIQNFASNQDYLVKKTFSITDIIKDINTSVHNQEDKFYKIPSNDSEIANYMLLYELSGGEELEKIVSADLKTARLMIYVKTTDAKTYKKFHNLLKSYIEKIMPDSYTFNITGRGYLSTKGISDIKETLIKSLSLGIIFISLLMIVVFRSVKIGLISMISNIFPIFFGLALLGYSGIWLSHITSLGACILIGIAVDDTIHFVARFKSEFERTRNYELALRNTMINVGHALLITTIVICIGFGVFMASKMAMLFYVGMLNSICVVVALIADFFLTPALILQFRLFGNETDGPKKEEQLGGEPQKLDKWLSSELQ